ncbi:MAG: hypothetical protein Q7S90_05480 [Rubrivivax sp.]|nr:hypothetical protein [Rubrivivax sp.]
MGKLWRSLLIWALALLLPMQGMASASGVLCAPGHGPTPLSTPGHGAQAAHAYHGAQEAAAGRVVEASHPHHGMVGAGAAPGADALDGVASPHPPENSCSACGDCCSGAALPSSPVALASMDAAGPAQRPPAGGLASVVGCGLERPPRAQRT